MNHVGGMKGERMRDSIYRQEAIDALLNTEHTMFDTDGYIWVNRNEVRLRIESLPSVEPEIIRCRACKHHILHKRLSVPWCRLLHIDMGDDQFCSCAERREDG